jgi:hypothetical protein
MYVVFLLLNVFLLASSSNRGTVTTATRRENVNFHNELYHTKGVFIAVHEMQLCVILTV